MALTQGHFQAYDFNRMVALFTMMNDEVKVPCAVSTDASEVPVMGYDPRPWNGFTDYCFYHPDGTVLAVIEAIRPSYLRGFALQRDHK